MPQKKRQLKTIEEIKADPKFQAFSPEVQKIILRRRRIGAPGVISPQDIALTQQPKLTVGPVEEFGKGAVEITGLENIPKGLSFMAQHPIESAKLLPDLPVSILKAHGEQFRRAGRSIQRMKERKDLGGAVLAGMQGALSFIPLMGPVAGETIEAQQTGEISGPRAAGHAVGLGATLGLGKLGSRVRKRKSVGDVPHTPADIGGPWRQFGQTVVEKSMPGAASFIPYRRKLQGKLWTKVEVELNRISSEARSPQQAGTDVLLNLEESMSRLKGEGAKLYGEVDRLTKVTTKKVPFIEQRPSQIVGPSGEALTFSKKTLRKVETGGVSVSTTSLRAFAVKELRRIRAAARLFNPDTLKRVTTQLEQILRSPKQVPFEAAHISRSELLLITRKINSTVGTREQGAAQTFSKLLDTEMEMAAKAAPNPTVYTKWRAANAHWREFREVSNRTIDNAIRYAERRPEDYSRQLRDLPIQSIHDLKANVDPATWQSLKEHYLRQGLLEAMKGEQLIPFPKAGKLAEYFPSAEGFGEATILRADKLSNWLEGHGKKAAGQADVRLEAIFTLEEARNIIEIKRLAHAIAPKKGGMATIAMPIFNAGMITGAGFALLNGNLQALGALTSMGITLYVLGKIMTRPEGIRILRASVKAAGDQRKLLILGMSAARMVEQVLQREKRQKERKQTPVPPDSSFLEFLTGSFPGIGTPLHR